MKKHIILPFFAVMAALLGCLLRCWELWTAFDLYTGLPVPGAVATPVLAGVTVLVALLLLVAVRTKKLEIADYDSGFLAKCNQNYLFAMFAAGGLMAISGAVNLLALPAVYEEMRMAAASVGSVVRISSVVPRALTGVLSLLSCGGLCWLGVHNYRGVGRGKYALATMLPPFAVSLFLITVYQQRSGDPVVLDYVYQILGIITWMLASYYMASCAFEKCRPTLVVYFSLLGVYFAGVTFPDDMELYCRLLAGGMALYLLATAAIILVNGTKETREDIQNG